MLRDTAYQTADLIRKNYIAYIKQYSSGIFTELETTCLTEVAISKFSNPASISRAQKEESIYKSWAKLAPERQEEVKYKIKDMLNLDLANVGLKKDEDNPLAVFHKSVFALLHALI